MDNLRKTVGYRIVDALAFKNLRQKDLAKELGVKDHIISYFASGERTPNTEQLVKIAQFLGVTTDYLLGLSNNRTLENAGIGAETGLSDEAIQNIKENKDDFFYRQGLDMIARDPLLCSMIAQYLYGFAAEQIEDTDYRAVLLSVQYLPEFSHVAFAKIIEHLANLQTKTKTQHENDGAFMDCLYLNFLSLCASPHLDYKMQAEKFALFAKNLRENQKVGALGALDEDMIQECERGAAAIDRFAQFMKSQGSASGIIDYGIGARLTHAETLDGYVDTLRQKKGASKCPR